jgi:hypothetical protein
MASHFTALNAVFNAFTSIFPFCNPVAAVPPAIPVAFNCVFKPATAAVAAAVGPIKDV